MNDREQATKNYEERERAEELRELEACGVVEARAPVSRPRPCKYCSTPISWRGRLPFEADGSRHRCQAYRAAREAEERQQLGLPFGAEARREA